MVEARTVFAERIPIRVLAVFIAAFLLQGASLAVFQKDRPVLRNERQSKLSGWMSRVMVSKIFSVTTTEDAGPGSLREAIFDANANPGLDQIRFAFNNPVTVTLLSPLIITDPVDIEASGPWITDTNPGYITVDGNSLTGDMFVITGTLNTSIRRLRLINVDSGFGFLVSGVAGGTELISNTVMNSEGGVRFRNSGHITATRNAFFDLADAGLDASGGGSLLLQQNLIRNVGGTGIRLMDGISNTSVLTNTISGVFQEFGSALIVSGDPPPTGIVMRGNHFTDTFDTIFLGPGANNGFPAPEVVKAFEPFTNTNVIQFSAKSPANPISYTYPLLMDLYRVRNGNYLPLGTSVMYDMEAFPATVTYTVVMSNTHLLSTDELALIATTFNPSSSEFSDPVPLLSPPDADGDGIADGDDLCPGTVIPEAEVPSFELGLNRFALVDDDVIFDTTAPEGRGPSRTYTTEDTGGCSCEQIIDELGVGGGHTRLGCSISVMDEWVAQVNSASKAGDAGGDTEPEVYAISQNYPNPFNPSTTIAFRVPERSRVTVRVFDIMGREVRVLMDATLDGGTYQVEWNGRNTNGQPVSSGLYVYRIEAGDYISAKTMILHR